MDIFTKVSDFLGRRALLKDIKKTTLKIWQTNVKKELKVRMHRGMHANPRDLRITRREISLRFRICDRLSASIIHMTSKVKLHRDTAVGRSYSGEG